MDKKWKVYVHINKENKKKYVGITSRDNPNDRWANGNGYYYNKHFYSAIKKNGWDGFHHIILYDNLSEQEAIEKEIWLISFYDSNNREFGYNQTSGGEGSPGVIVSEETRIKRSISLRKENLPPGTIEKRSMALKGRKFSKEHKQRIGIANSTPVNMYSVEGEFIKRFESMTIAEIETGAMHSHISQCCSGKRRTTAGYKWEYAC